MAPCESIWSRRPLPRQRFVPALTLIIYFLLCRFPWSLEAFPYLVAWITNEYYTSPTSWVSLGSLRFLQLAPPSRFLQVSLQISLVLPGGHPAASFSGEWLGPPRDCTLARFPWSLVESLGPTDIFATKQLLPPRSFAFS